LRIKTESSGQFLQFQPSLSVSDDDEVCPGVYTHDLLCRMEKDLMALDRNKPRYNANNLILRGEAKFTPEEGPIGVSGVQEGSKVEPQRQYDMLVRFPNSLAQ